MRKIRVNSCKFVDKYKKYRVNPWTNIKNIV